MKFGKLFAPRRIGKKLGTLYLSLYKQLDNTRGVARDLSINFQNKFVDVYVRQLIYMPNYSMICAMVLAVRS